LGHLRNSEVQETPPHP